LIFQSIPTKYQNRNKHSPHLLQPFSEPIVIAVYQSTWLKGSHSKQGDPTSFATKVITTSITASNVVEMVDVRGFLNISESRSFPKQKVRSQRPFVGFLTQKAHPNHIQITPQTDTTQTRT
jgi:hypothetical protein